MKIYNIFIKEDESGKIQDVKLLQDGFSLSAFIFTPLWFLYYKMWREFFAVIIFVFLLQFLAEKSLIFDGILLQIILTIMVAFNSNYWLAQHLQKKKKYKFIGAVFGKNNAQARINLVREFRLNFQDFSA
jgi:hypothetical protein